VKAPLSQRYLFDPKPNSLRDHSSHRLTELFRCNFRAALEKAITEFILPARLQGILMRFQKTCAVVALISVCLATVYAGLISGTIFSMVPNLAQADELPMKPESNPVAKAPITWAQLQALPLPPAGERITYGTAPQHFGELRVPKGKGPFPVVMLIHGGCWLADFDYRYITRLSAALTAEGYATWTPEFRRIGDSSGGWPNTLLDVGAATDHLRALAPKYHLDLHHVIALGHSSGGHLALWLAARHKLPQDSPLFSAKPIALAGVIGLAAITDLTSYRIGPPDSCHASVDQLLEGTPETQPQRYAQTSPLALLPLGVPQQFIDGSADRIVDPESVRAYVIAATKAGDHAELAMIAGDGHFDVVVAEREAWTQILVALKQLASAAE
jgi:acetyl esterase/lipase